ncbi:MAG TPA: FtsQ-type POTRA domain-containing protein [Rubricoccaceae bacterium]
MATRSTTPVRQTRGPRPGRAGRILRRLGAAALVLALGAAYVWQRTLPLRRVAVTGTVHADADEIVRLTGARPDSDAVFSLSPALVADRAQRHPWVRTAHVRRLPTGTLSVRVEERVPVVLVMRAGRPAGYLDADGVALPLDAASDSGVVPYDVPLLTGAVPDVAPGGRVASASLRETLAALAAADDATDALVSEVEWHPSGRAVLWTTPAGGHPSVPVRLGRTGVADQLARLRAFWDQSVLPRPRARFRSVDLRFEGQVVTQEGRPPAPDSSRSAPGRSTPAAG